MINVETNMGRILAKDIWTPHLNLKCVISKKWIFFLQNGSLGLEKW